MTKLDLLEKELRTEDGIILEVQEKIAHRICKYLHAHGFLYNGIGKGEKHLKNIKADTKGREWIWDSGFGVEIKFRNPYYRNMTAFREVPVEKSRKPEEALSLTTSNRSSAAIQRNISKTHTVRTDATIAKTDSYNFNVTAGVKGGFSSGFVGVSGNGGIQTLGYLDISLETSFGGEFIRNWIDEKGESTSRTISDVLNLEPLSEYSIVANVDKIELEQTIKKEGYLDFEIEIDLTNAEGKDSQDHSFKNDKFTVPHLKDLVRLLLGMIGNPIARVDKFKKEKLKHDEGYDVLLRSILDDEYRRVKAETTLEYKDAGDVTMTVIKVGTWENKDGEWVLHRLI